MWCTYYASPPLQSVPARGILKNYNTIEEFKNADKRALFNKLSDEVFAAFLCPLHSELALSLDKGSRMARANSLAP